MSHALPEDLVIRRQQAPIIYDSTLGVTVAAARAVPDAPARYPFVAIGDSLTHGVQSGAVFHTEQSWPAQVARAIGAAPFDYPHYGGPVNGLPVNIEAVLRRVEDRYDTVLAAWEVLPAIATVWNLLDANEDYWERTYQLPANDVGTRAQNLGIYGWDVRDALSVDVSSLRQRIAKSPPTDSLSGFKPEHDNDIAALSVLAPFGSEATQLTAARHLAADGGIDTLVVALGANNALDAVVSKQVRWSAEGYDDPKRKGSFNVWTPTHFALEYGLLAAQVEVIGARRVVLATVPHVTIVPIAHGVNRANPGAKAEVGSRYFPYYVDPWVSEGQFDPNKHRHLKADEARAVDSAIDAYNETIQTTVAAARERGLDWFLFDLAGLLDRLAERRFLADPDAQQAAEATGWTPYDLPAELKALNVTTERYESNRRGRQKGGLFSLDSIHPTTAGYGIVAHELLGVLRQAGTPGASGAGIDFVALVNADALLANPPKLLDRAFELAGPLLRRTVSALKPSRPATG